MRIIDNKYLHIALGAFMISFSAVFVKASNISGELAGFYRTFLGSIPLFFAAIFTIRKNKINITFKKIFFPVIGGIFFFGDLFVWHKSIHYIGPGLATVLANFQVFILAAIGVLFLKEKLSLKFLISLPFIFTGLMMITSTGDFALTSDFGKGIILGLTTALFYTAYILSLKKARQYAPDFNAYIVMFFVSISTAIIFFIYLKASSLSMLIPDHNSLIFMILYGVSSQFIAWIIISNALTEVKASIAGLLLLLQPSLSFVWDIIIFNKAVNPIEVTGAVLALVFIYIGTQKTK